MKHKQDEQDGLGDSELKKPFLKQPTKTTADKLFHKQIKVRKAKEDIAEKMRLIDLTSDAILIRDVNGLISFWNAGAEKMYGWSREEALGKRSHDLLKTEFPKPYDEITGELYRTGHWTGEFVHTTRDGRRITVLARKALDRDSEGKPAAILQTLTDITERKREESTLFRLAAIIESSNDAIVSKDLNGLITSWNPAAERLFGYTEQEALGRSVTMLLPLNHTDDESHIISRIRNGERIERYETIRRRKDGSLVDISLTVSPIKDRTGRIIGASKIVRDISERKLAEESLRESEERFRVLANSMPQLAWSARGDGFIHWFNQRWFDYTGTTPEEMLGWGWQSIHNPAMLPKVLERWNASIATGEVFEMTFPLRGADGVYRPFLTRVVPIKNTAGNVVQWFGTNTDVDEIKRAEESERAAAERFRFLAESSPQKIFTAAPNGEFIYYNKQWSQFTGKTDAELRVEGLMHSIYLGDFNATMIRWNHSLETGECFEHKHRFQRYDGVYRWHISRAQPMRNENGEPILWIGSSTDIDDMMRVQEELKHAHALLTDRAVQLEALVEERTSKLKKAHIRLLEEAIERQRLEAEIADAVEEERLKLGQELHDGIAQDLFGIAMLLHVLERKMTKISAPFADEAGKLCQMLENAHKQSRNLAKNFYPIELYHHGLWTALQNFAKHIQETFHILCLVKSDQVESAQINDTTAIQLFRIAQEATHNASKHAKASEIVITLDKHNGAWLLTIKDNGVGLPNDEQGSNGMGLRIMNTAVPQESIT